MAIHTIIQGECVGSIAAEEGFRGETIWNAPENLELRRERPNPNQLLPGDALFIPEKRRRDEAAATDQKHRFRAKGFPAVLRLRLLDNGNPRRREGWTAEIDGLFKRGATDQDGAVEIKLDPRTAAVTLRLDSGVEYKLQLRGLDPIETVSGVQARLNNLGYECGPANGVEGPLLEGAVRQFQEDHPPLDVTGTLDEETHTELKDAYGS